MPATPQTPCYDPDEPVRPEDDNPFDEVEFLPGLGVAVLWVVLAYVLVNLLLLPVQGA